MQITADMDKATLCSLKHVLVQREMENGGSLLVSIWPFSAASVNDTAHSGW